MPENDLATEFTGLKVKPKQITGQPYVEGEVYRFDGVRVLCENVHVNWAAGYNSAIGHYPWRSHTEVGCPGWTASTDLAVWERAIFKAWPDAHLRLEHGFTKFLPDCVDHEHNPKGSMRHMKWFIAKGADLPALLSCVKQVLEKEAHDA